MRARLYITILMLVLLSFCTTAQSQESVYYHDAAYPFIIITKDTVEQAPVLSDEEFYRNSKGVIFRVNSTDIPATDNFMTLYRDSVLPWVNANHLQLRKVYVRGAASPEGSYANNQRLGNGRSQALLSALRRDLSGQYIEMAADVSSVTEDYGYLCLLMKEANDPDYLLVKTIYDECAGDEQCCKQRLQEAKHRQLWPRLLREYFPRLRSARFILWFSEPDSVHAPLPLHIQPMDPMALAVKLPQVKVERDDDLLISQFISQPGETGNAAHTRRHLVAIRTNLLHDLFYMPGIGWTPSPNIQFEFYPRGGHLTYNLGMTWGTHRKWDSHEFFQVRDFQFELRRYFQGEGKFTGLYLAAFLEGNVYGIGLGKKDGWEGEGGGAGLSIGYVIPLNKKKNLRLEFMAAAGLYRTYNDPYVYGNPVTGTEDGKYYYDYLGTASAFKKRNHVMNWLGPTNLGVQLTYDIIYRKRSYKR